MTYTEDELRRMTVKQLRAIAKRHNVSLSYSGSTKAGIVTELLIVQCYRGGDLEGWSK